MRARIGCWGGSHAVRLPKAAVEALELKEGVEVSIQVIDGALLLQPRAPEYQLADLVSEAARCDAPDAIGDEQAGSEAI